MFHSPSGESNLGHTVLLCNPFGQEAIRCHRMLRILAERLCRAGFHVMRFDYFGTGDSDGDDMEVSLKTWIDDVLRANDEAARLSGNKRYSWFGLRLGANVAAMASARAANPPELLVFWDPVVSGAHYLGSLARTQIAETRALQESPNRTYPPTSEVRPSEVLGFPLTPSMLDDIRALSAETFSTMRAGRSKIYTSPHAEDTNAIAMQLKASSIPVDEQRINTDIVWASHEAMNTAIVPTEPLLAIVNAFAETQ
jgi:uncharacterized protein